MKRAVNVAAIALASLWAAPLIAQRPLGVSGSAGITVVELAREGTLSRRWSGSMMGARGAVTLHRFTLDASYAQGAVTPGVGTLGDGEDLVDGAVQLRVWVLPWLSVGGGPHLRAFVSPAGTSRWTRFEARARAEGEIINGIAFAHFEGWYALAVDANVLGGGSGAQGGEAGISIRLPRAPIALQLIYSADRATFTNGGSEFLEGVRFSLAFERF